jgi:WG containing repeat
MRKLLHISFITIILFSFYETKAQDILAENKGTQSGNGNMSTRTAERKDALHARKSIMVILNRFRELNSTVEENNMSPEAIQQSINAQKNETANSGSFSEYLEKMKDVLGKRLEGLTGSDEQVAIQKARLMGANNILVSAKCLESQVHNSFVETKDIDGNYLISFPVDSLRKGTRFGTVDNYREGFARVRKDQVFGYLNLCGEENITSQYAKAEPFNGGRALVKRVEWYFIDANGEESNALEGITEGKALVRGVTLVRLSDGRQTLIDNKFDVTKKPISQSFESIESFYQNVVFKVRNLKKFGLLGVDGKVKLEVNYDNIEATKVPGVYKIAFGAMVGLIDTSWTIKVPPTYNSISEFNKYGLATAVSDKGVILVQKGTFKTTKIYKSVSDFNEYGVATFLDESGKYGLIDAEMKIVLEPKYASISAFNEIGLASACLEAGKCGYIKFDGSEQIKASYESVSAFNSFGLTVAKKAVENCGNKGNEKCSADLVLDKSGNIIIPATDESIAKKTRFKLTDSLHSVHYIIVNATNNDNSTINYMLIDKNNLKQITNIPYQTITSLDPNGNFRMKDNDLWGLIDSAGTIMSKCQYKEIRRVGETYYAAQNEKGMWGFLNKKGKPQIEFEYEEVRQYRNGLAPVSKGKNKWGIISKFNAKIVPCVFKSIVMNGAETKFEVTDQEGTVFIINEKGECESNCAKFEEIRNKANKQE